MSERRQTAYQYVMTGYEDKGGKLIAGESVHTDKKGIARIELAGAGKWYVRLINLTRLDDPKLDYESKWATLTFELK